MQEESKVVKVQIKWGAEKFIDIPFEISSPLEKFKNQIYELTNVPLDKQKIIFKGQTLKDDAILLNLKIQDGAQIMLMGQTEKNAVKQSDVKTVFLEDLTPDERAKILKEKAGIILPIGLENMGNTCYLNSSVQCLKRVNELKKYLTESPQQLNAPVPAQSKALYNATSKLINQLETRGEAFKPQEFVQTFMKIFPMFADRDQNGQFKQQDADECFQNILNVLEPLCIYENQQGEKRNLIKDLFEIKMEVTLQNLDIPEEPATTSVEYHKKFMCMIENDVNPINNLIDGVKISLTGQLEKKSEIDNMNHLYTKTQRIDKLPSYLLVQMVRFNWKQGQNGKEGVKAKILRNVAFPKILDIFEFCSKNLQQNLNAGREYEKKQTQENLKQDSDKLEQFKKKMETQGQMLPDDTKEIYKKFKEHQTEENLKNHDLNLYREHGQGLENGCYQIIGVLTHKGREADSGHYVAWIHHSGEQWICYDDDKVTEVNTEKILDLRGGGDWHMGYYLLYRKQEIQ